MAGRRIAEAHVLQWDEFPIALRSAWEAVLALLDVLKESLSEIYVSKIIICYGDFRQIPPFIRRSTRQGQRRFGQHSAHLARQLRGAQTLPEVRGEVLIDRIRGWRRIDPSSASEKRRPAQKARPVKEVMKKVMKKARK